jgi:hypothetical protein
MNIKIRICKNSMTRRWPSSLATLSRLAFVSRFPKVICCRVCLSFSCVFFTSISQRYLTQLADPLLY